MRQDAELAVEQRFTQSQGLGVNFNAALETGGVVVSDSVKLEIEVEAIATE